tara:strand:+ start:283 stop:639 length:357 start_codon:yes stop_codon:yes gene_type:complete
MKFGKLLKITTAALLASALTGCIGAVVGVAVDTTVAVVKAPFQIAGAVVEVAAGTAGTVIAAPFRAVDAAIGSDRHAVGYHEEGGHGGAEEATGEEIRSHGHNNGSHEHFREHEGSES